MSIFSPLLVTRVIIILGVINLVTGVLIFFSCRCFPGSKLGNRLMKHKTYQRFLSTTAIYGECSGLR